MDDDLMVALVRGMAPFIDVSDTKNASQVLDEVATVMQLTGSEWVTGEMVAERMKDMLEEYESFTWYVSRPGIVYVADRNWVITTADYINLHAGEETWKVMEFRLNGMPLYNILRSIFKEFDMKNVDWDWICLDLGGADGSGCLNLNHHTDERHKYFLLESQ